MEDNKQLNATAIADEHTPRNLSRSENLILTIKIVLGGGAVLALIWGIDQLATG